MATFLLHDESSTPPPPADAPRSWHRWYAQAAGYFWLPCPLCGEYFGGHEWVQQSGVFSSIPDPDDSRLGIGICSTCTSAGRGVDPFAELFDEDGRPDA